MVHAVIFDMYETLVTQFSSPLYYGTQIARDLGLDPDVFLPGWRATEEARATGKMTTEEALAACMRVHGIFSPELHRKITAKRTAIQKDCFSHIHPQIFSLLNALKAKEIKIGLITNCFSEEAALIRESPLFPFFDAPCLSYEAGIRKPDPAIYHRCMKLLDVPGENCLYVGDGGSNELEAAKALGMRAVQATWYRKAEFENRLVSIQPDFTQISQPLILLELIGEVL